LIEKLLLSKFLAQQFTIANHVDGYRNTGLSSRNWYNRLDQILNLIIITTNIDRDCSDRNERQWLWSFYYKILNLIQLSICSKTKKSF
jgi:hypothetical protein